MKKKHSLGLQGFTLIELSIVLVIIALIVGGVLGGTEMIYQAKVKRMMKEVDEYKTAVHVFKGKYNCLPGDCPLAYNFFSSNCSGSAWTCNGNGDGIVSQTHATTAIMLEPQEAFMFWKHLYLAGFASAVTGEAANNPISQNGVNQPMSPTYGRAGYGTSHIRLSGIPVGHYFYLGTDNPASDNSYFAHNPVVTAMQAYEIDNKYDDGIANGGMMWGGPGYGGLGVYPCWTGPPYAYNTGNTGINCNMTFAKVY